MRTRSTVRTAQSRKKRTNVDQISFSNLRPPHGRGARKSVEVPFLAADSLYWDTRPARCAGTTVRVQYGVVHEEGRVWGF